MEYWLSGEKRKTPINWPTFGVTFGVLHNGDFASSYSRNVPLALKNTHVPCQASPLETCRHHPQIQRRYFLFPNVILPPAYVNRLMMSNYCVGGWRCTLIVFVSPGIPWWRCGRSCQGRRITSLCPPVCRSAAVAGAAPTRHWSVCPHSHTLSPWS